MKNRLKKLREENRLSQTQAAKKIGVTVGAYSNWEHGNRVPELDWIKKIAKTFNVTVQWIIEGNGKIENDLTSDEWLLIDEWLRHSEIMDLFEDIDPEVFEPIKVKVNVIAETIRYHGLQQGE